MKPLVLLDPVPRTAREIFSPASRARLEAAFEVIERAEADDPAAFYAEHLARAAFVVGQPELDARAIASAAALRGIVNVEGNFLPNLDYVATVTAESTRLIGSRELALMPDGALLLLMSRADVVDFPSLLDACREGRIRAATDVFPEEPVAADDPLRATPNLLLSAHRAGALESALLEIGERTVEDLELMARGLPPQSCKRAEPELVGRLRSRPVDRS